MNNFEDQNQRGEQQNQGDIRSSLQNFFRTQYDKESFKREWKQKSRELWEIMPLFLQILLTSKLMLYVLSFITSSVNEFLVSNPSKVLSYFQIWRLVTSPFACGSLFELFIITSIYLIKYLYPTEFKRGTLFIMIKFGINICCYNFISCALSLPFILLSSSFSSYEQSGLFPLILIDISVKMFENINGKTNLYFGVLENQYTIPLMYAGVFFFMDEKLISILSIAIVSYMIAKGLYLTHLLIPNDRLKVIEQKVNPVFQKFPSKIFKVVIYLDFISVTQAEINVAQNTDDIASFDRRQLRGRVSQPGNGYDSYNSTQANSSFNSIGGGIMLGGSKDRDDSVLRSQDTSLALIMQTERSSNESENDQNEERKLNSESDEYAV